MRKKWIRFTLLVLVGSAFYVYLHPEIWRRPSVKIATSISRQGSLPSPAVRDFTEAKKIAAVLYQAYPYTFYCGCRFSGKHVDHSACGYKPLHDTPRAHRLEWEHIVPAHAFGQAFVEWRNGALSCVHQSGEAYRGRSCARVASPTFKQMEADLYNLVPAIGEVNQLRADFPMGLLPGVAPMFGKCQTKIFHGMIEPRPEVRGFVARTYKYMENRYPGFHLVNDTNRGLLEQWNREHPPDAFERERGRKIALIQGNENPFL